MARDTQEIGDERVISSVITVQSTPDEAYAHWRNLPTLPRFIRNLVSVTEDGTRSHWVVDTPSGETAWDSEITQDIPGSMIQWESADNGVVAHRGSVRFAKARQGRATEVYLTISYRPPAGKLGLAAAKLLGEAPGTRMDTDLHRFKQLVEVGTIATTLGQPRGKAQRDDWEDEQQERAEDNPATADASVPDGSASINEGAST